MMAGPLYSKDCEKIARNETKIVKCIEKTKYKTFINNSTKNESL